MSASLRSVLWPLPEDDITGLTTHGALDCGDRLAVFGSGIDKAVRRGRQAQGFGDQATDAFAVHGQTRGTRGGDHLLPLLVLQRHQGLGVDGFDLRHDQVRLLLGDQRPQGLRVEHVQHVRTMRHLHGRCVGIPIGGNHFHPEALQLDGDLLAQFARAQQQHTGGGRRQRRDESGHERGPDREGPPF